MESINSKTKRKSSCKGCEESGVDPAGYSFNQEGSSNKAKTSGGDDGLRLPSEEASITSCQVVLARDVMPPPRELVRRTARASDRSSSERKSACTPTRPVFASKPEPKCSKTLVDPRPGPSSLLGGCTGDTTEMSDGGSDESGASAPALTAETETGSGGGASWGPKARALVENTRKRGRPASTGEWVGVGLARAEKARLDAEEVDGRLAKMTADLLSNASVVLAREDVGGMAGVPTRELLSATSDSLEAINSLRKLAKGLNGRHKGTIRMGVAQLEIAIGELATRVDKAAMRRDGGHPSENTLERALEAERERTRRAEEKIVLLNAEVARLRAAALPDEPPPPLRGKRRGVIEDSSSSSEGRSTPTRRVVKRKRKGRGLTPEIEDEEEMMSHVRPVSPSPQSLEPLPQGKDRERAFPLLVNMEEENAEEAPRSPVRTRTYAGVMGGEDRREAKEGGGKGASEKGDEDIVTRNGALVAAAVAREMGGLRKELRLPATVPPSPSEWGRERRRGGESGQERTQGGG